MFKKVLVWIICKTLPTCKDTTELVSRSLETELSRREKIKMKLHLWSCLACRRYLTQIKFMSKIFEHREKKLKTEKPVPVLSPDAVERLKNALNRSKFLLIFALMSYL